MRTLSVFAIFCLAVGIIPSFALPTKDGDSKPNEISKEPTAMRGTSQHSSENSHHHDSARAFAEDFERKVMALAHPHDGPVFKDSTRNREEREARERGISADKKGYGVIDDDSW
ncbi:hypothetical protein F5148DRAFT_1241132 [Russula earlei]|uniref:Uncharacterized protein n=1 Tax=Russula earlei TaxID=71964 RepID=A0ACC0TVJ0_9AGAM|nr:hypothetical protein F5148DRAFT_1241132 [Russula earlei]